MKRKYKRFTQNFMYGITWVHKNRSGVKEFIFKKSQLRLRIKRHYHLKFDEVLEGLLDCRRARRIVSNAALFERHFEKQLNCLRLQINYPSKGYL